MEEIGNVEQAAAWDGAEGAGWARNAAGYERTNVRHRARLIAAAKISVGENVLDVGCGTGALAREVAPLAYPGTVLGIDLSSAMLGHAAASAGDLDNLRFMRGDAQTYPFQAGHFDVAISCFGAMFFADPAAAFGNIAMALAPGGRVALLAWQKLNANEWLTALRSALSVGRQLPTPPDGVPGPFGLADPAMARTSLAAAGFTDIACASVSEPVDFGADLEQAWTFVRELGVVHGLLADLSEEQVADAMAALRRTLASHDTRDGVLFGSAAWLVTARRSP